MKRKSILLGWTVLIVAMICCWAFTSCGDDKEEGQQNPLFGAWEVTSDKAVIEQLEQMIVTNLAQHGEISQETIEVLTQAKEIITTAQFVVLFNSDGTARLYAYRNGVGPFLSGTWTMTEQALILKVGSVELPITNIQTDGKVLQCNIGQLPLTFKKYRS